MKTTRKVSKIEEIRKDIKKTFGRDLNLEYAIKRYTKRGHKASNIVAAWCMVNRCFEADPTKGLKKALRGQFYGVTVKVKRINDRINVVCKNVENGTQKQVRAVVKENLDWFGISSAFVAVETI